MACNIEADLETWRAISLARHVNTPSPGTKGPNALKPAGFGPKGLPLRYILAALLEAPQVCQASISIIRRKYTRNLY